MLDKNGVSYYLQGLSYVRGKWDRYVRSQRESATPEQRLADIKSMAGDIEPLSKLRSYLLQQFRAIRRDESLLRRVSSALDDSHTVSDRLSIDEQIEAALLLVITNIDGLDELFKQKWPTSAEEFVKRLDAVTVGLNSLRICSMRFQEALPKNDAVKSLLLQAPIAEHDKEIHRILSEFL